MRTLIIHLKNQLQPLQFNFTEAESCQEAYMRTTSSRRDAIKGLEILDDLGSRAMIDASEIIYHQMQDNEAIIKAKLELQLFEQNQIGKINQREAAKPRLAVP